MMKASFPAVVLKWPSNLLTCIKVHSSWHTVLINHWNCSFQSPPAQPHTAFYTSHHKLLFITLIHIRHHLMNGFLPFGEWWFLSSSGIRAEYAGLIIYHASTSFPLFLSLFVSVSCTSLWTIRFWGKKTVFLLCVIWSLPQRVCSGLCGNCDSEWLGLWGDFKGCS